MPPPGLLRFGPFEFDVRAGDLIKHGVRIHLPDQASQVLLMLLEHPGEVVLRSEIRERLWAGDTVVDFDQSINSAVKRLRNALAESADSRRYIETVSKRGYRFIGELRPEGEAPPEPKVPDAPRYRLLEKLGEGGVGEVYRAEDLRLGRQVAVKFLRGGEALPDAALAALEQEARAASALNHPHICTIHGLEEVEGRRGIVMELVAGETLASRLALGPLPPRECLQIALQMAGALAEAHAAGIVHGDLKPANLMLTKNGVKVLDFGLSSKQSGVVQDESTSPQYLSPEQRQGRPADARSDIFSLGIVLQEMLAGIVPPDVAAFLARCLAHDPRDRWPSAEAAQTELERIVQAQAEPVLRPRRHIWPLALAPLAMVLAVAAGVSLWRGEQTTSLPARAVPLTTLAGEQNFPAFSPDGEKVAFSWIGPPRQDGRKAMNIYVKSILNGETVAITNGPTVDRFPQWSPDGSQIGFVRSNAAGRADLMIVAAAGGPERKIWEAGSGLSWSPDGNEIAYVSAETPSSGSILARSVKTGAVRPITHPKILYDALPAWSPDGKRIAFARQLENGVRELFVVPSQGGEVRQLTFDGRYIDGFSWTPDSRELVFDSTLKTGGNLWRISAAGGSPARVAYVARHPLFPAISPRGSRLVFSDSFVDSNIWQYELGGLDQRSAGPARPKCLLCSTVEDDSPRISADGSKIVFVSWRSGAEELWTANRDGSSPKQLTFLEARVGSPRWSPDGRWIAFDSRAGGKPDVYVIAAAGGAPRRLATDVKWKFEPSWSHDGRWIYFLAETEGRLAHIWKAPFGGGPARQVTVGDGGECQESPDGERLYYFHRLHDDGIWTVPVEGGVEQSVPELLDVRRTRAWAVREKGIYFYQEVDGKPLIRFFDFATRRVNTVMAPELPTPHGNPGLDVSPDGRTLLYTQIDKRVDGLMMVENFR